MVGVEAVIGGGKPYFRLKAQQPAISAVSTASCELRAAGQLGNLLLPKKLYEFIGAEITNGHSSTPSDVVVAAMPYLKAPATP